MDFVVGTVEGHDYIWAVVDRLTKLSHFIPIKVTFFMERLVEIYVANIVCLHGVSLSITSDRDARFTTKF